MSVQKNLCCYILRSVVNSSVVLSEFAERTYSGEALALRGVPILTYISQVVIYTRITAGFTPSPIRGLEAQSPLWKPQQAHRTANSLASLLNPDSFDSDDFTINFTIYFKILMTREKNHNSELKISHTIIIFQNYYKIQIFYKGTLCKSITSVVKKNTCHLSGTQIFNTQVMLSHKFGKL